MYLDTLESQLKQMIKKSKAERVARKVQKKNTTSGMEEFTTIGICNFKKKGF